MRIKIKNVTDTGYGTAWYMRDYLNGRTCEVLAIETKQTKKGNPPYKAYFVLHPKTKKTGYWVMEKYCEVIENSPVPTWNEFLDNNDYGYSRS